MTKVTDFDNPLNGVKIKVQEGYNDERLTKTAKTERQMFQDLHSQTKSWPSINEKTSLL